jgi:hypothetical protein
VRRTTEQANSLIKTAAMVVAGLYLYRRFTENTAEESAALVGPPGMLGPTHGSVPTHPEVAVPASGVTPLGRFVVGWGVVFVVLSVAAGPYPTLAGNMALLLMIASLIANGSAVSKDLGKGLQSAKQGKQPKGEASRGHAHAAPGSVVAPPIPEVRSV